MIDATNMSNPVTRGELRAELEQFEVRLDHKLDQRLAPLVTKAELEQRLAPLATKTELEQRLAPLATKTELELWGGALLARIEAFEQRFLTLEERLLTELARHTKASHEDLLTQISVIEEKYADLPPRVSRLEAKMSTPRRR